MNRPLHNAFILVFAIALISAAGCQKAQAPSEKKSRLIAAENIELKKQLAQRDKQIEGLKTKHAAQIKQEQGKLTQCQKQTADCRQQLKEDMDEKVNEVLVAMMDESAKIRMENLALKAEIDELKAKLNRPDESEKKEQ